MDDIDRILLDAVQADGRRPLAALAELAGLSTSAVNERLRRLLADGTLAGIHGRVDARLAGFDVCAFVEVLLAAPGDDAGFIAGCLGEPQVQECHHVTGDWSYLLKVRARTTGDLERLIGATIKTWPGVVRTRTTLALSSPKETAALPCAARPA
ncbi:Lrp/AsnC family leucine-responsive transcriptional regulator [Stella humosa]|uniref:Lrp/AsnC family leucine-responsive transcriptional regulator n=1 Tax=Stella humosa TaxID=94 RepID=A0A3N1L4C9_9PROT|nr:Lrp/AsnC family transcriptional regulator [Stella humosa]ROP84265.1 Lrp/AsnC family leucine-responsive transcriptional regulator [Stella humosa]BBK33778.1 AsnC family transcriptional regulator [Stella humosa]